MLTARTTLLRGSGLIIVALVSFIHSVLCRVPTADLRQHHDRQQCRKHKPCNVAFAIRRDNHRRQQQGPGTAKVAADLKDRLRQP